MITITALDESASGTAALCHWMGPMSFSCLGLPGSFPGLKKASTFRAWPYRIHNSWAVLKRAHRILPGCMFTNLNPRGQHSCEQTPVLASVFVQVPFSFISRRGHPKVYQSVRFRRPTSLESLSKTSPRGIVPTRKRRRRLGLQICNNSTPQTRKEM